MLRELLKTQYEEYPPFLEAVDTLRQDFHVYDEDEGVVYEEDALEYWDWASGVSKICIKFSNIVVKKGFYGYVSDYDFDKNEWLDDPIYTEWDVDYGRLECKVYQKAVEKGVEDFLAEVEYLGDGVYAQEKMDMNVEDYHGALTAGDHLPDKWEIPRESLFTINECDICDVIEEICKVFDLMPLLRRSNYMVVNYLLGTYEPEELKRLQNFLEMYDINDIHGGNIGWSQMDGRLKLFDYSGYHSNTSEKIKS